MSFPFIFFKYLLIIENICAQESQLTLYISLNGLHFAFQFYFVFMKKFVMRILALNHQTLYIWKGGGGSCIMLVVTFSVSTGFDQEYPRSTIH